METQYIPPLLYQLREVALKSFDFKSAAKNLTKLQLMTGGYFILADHEGGTGKIIQKGPEPGDYESAEMGKDSKEQFILKTNTDFQHEEESQLHSFIRRLLRKVGKKNWTP